MVITIYRYRSEISNLKEIDDKRILNCNDLHTTQFQNRFNAAYKFPIYIKMNVCKLINFKKLHAQTNLFRRKR